MKPFDNDKKEIQTLPFSYIDIFFILLAGLVLSFGIYFATEKRQENKEELYRIEMTSSIEEGMEEIVPEAGERIFENKEAVGEILSVEKEKTENDLSIRVVCLWKGKDVQVGQEKVIETLSCICTMQIDSVERAEDSMEGRYFD